MVLPLSVFKLGDCPHTLVEMVRSQGKGRENCQNGSVSLALFRRPYLFVLLALRRSAAGIRCSGRGAVLRALHSCRLAAREPVPERPKEPVERQRRLSIVALKIAVVLHIARVEREKRDFKKKKRYRAGRHSQPSRRPANSARYVRRVGATRRIF